MWIHFCKKLVEHLLAHVEAVECVVLFYESFESCKIDLIGTLGSVVKAIFEGRILCGHHQPNLLYG